MIDESQLTLFEELPPKRDVLREAEPQQLLSDPDPDSDPDLYETERRCRDGFGGD